MSVMVTMLRYQALVLMQAMLGIISPNFRRVWLSNERTLKICILLEKEDQEDFEEIEDLKAEFDALQDTVVEVDWNVSVSDLEMPLLDYSKSVVVYERRENSSSA